MFFQRYLAVYLYIRPKCCIFAQLKRYILLHRFDDIHTHVAGGPGTILSVPADEVGGLVADNDDLDMAMRQCYSLQLHPWHVTEARIAAFTEAAMRLRDDVQFVAVGECGLDGCCQTPEALQHVAFRQALAVAGSLHKPVIVHCVKRWEEMLADVREVMGKPPVDGYEPPIICHGFCKGVQLAQRLLDAGLCISLGKNYKPEVAKMVPPQRLYRETDQEQG